jgi:hypothetical protein
MEKHTDIILYILEWLSSWSSSRIRPSWPWSRLELSLLLVLFPKYIPCLIWATRHLAVCSNRSSFTLNPFIADWGLLTNVQVNNMAMLHGTYTTHIDTSHRYYYSSSTLYFFHSLWQAGWSRPFPSDTILYYLCAYLLTERMLQIRGWSLISWFRESDKVSL